MENIEVFKHCKADYNADKVMFTWQQENSIYAIRKLVIVSSDDDLYYGEPWHDFGNYKSVGVEKSDELYTLWDYVDREWLVYDKTQDKIFSVKEEGDNDHSSENETPLRKAFDKEIPMTNAIKQSIDEFFGPMKEELFEEFKGYLRQKNKPTNKMSESKESFGLFDDPKTKALSEKYLPVKGDGDNMATQAVTAASRLIYKWLNGGDVYDNRYYLKGFTNDISGSANWLANYIDGAYDILKRIKDCLDENDYVEILQDIHSLVFNESLLAKLEKLPKVGDAYTEEGPFEFEELIYCSGCGARISQDEANDYDGLCETCYEEENSEEDFNEEN